MPIYLLALLMSFVCASFCAPGIIRWYKKNNWIDHPDTHKHVKVVHTSPIPRGGGLVVGIATIVAMFIFIPFSIQIFTIGLGIITLSVMGFFDDIYDLNPYLRFILGGAVAATVVLVGKVTIPYITNPFGEGVIELSSQTMQLQFGQFSIAVSVLADLFAIIWILWNMNVVNWSKGVDGQLPGTVAIGAFFIALLANRFTGDPTQLPVIVLSLITTGTFLGLLLWNMYPQKMLPGYGAGSLGGFLLALLSILSGAKLATALLVLAIPTADAAFTIFRRLANKKSPFWGDRGHLHHKLLDVLGWSKRKIALFYWCTTALFGMIALQLKPEQKLFTIVLIISLVFGFLIWAKLFISFSKPLGQDNG